MVLFALAQVLWLTSSAFSSGANTPEYEAYVVQEHQSIASIAAEYAMPAADLARYNALRPSDPLTAGQILFVPIFPKTVPPPPPVTATQSSTVNADVPKGTLPGTTATVTTKQVSGTLARVSAQFAQIRTRPQGGQILFDKSPKGTELLVIEETATHYGVLMADGSTGWVERLAITMTDITMVVDRPDIKSTVVPRQDIVDTAMEYLGIPYKYGGALPENVDCSLLVQTVFARHGVKLPRTAAQQFDVGTPIEVQQLIPGDRLYYYDRDSARIGHTGIYIGNSRFVHASSTRGMVAVDEFTNQAFMNRYAGARR